jgi:hypothetical protein
VFYDDGPWDALGELETENHDRDRKTGERGGRHGDGVPGRAEGFYAMEEVAGNVAHAESKEVANLSAGDEDGDAVCETDDDWRGKYLTAVPMPVMPRSTSRTPAIMVHSKRPSMSCLAMIPEMTTTKAPVGRRFAFLNRQERR